MLLGNTTGGCKSGCKPRHLLFVGPWSHASSLGVAARGAPRFWMQEAVRGFSADTPDALWSNTALNIAKLPLLLIAGGPVAGIPEPTTSPQRLPQQVYGISEVLG